MSPNPRTATTKMNILLLLCTIPSIASFAFPSTSRSGSPHHKCHNHQPRDEVCYHQQSTKLSAESESGNSESSTNYNNESLKSLLPTPKKRTLKLDKFGRRVHDLTDDGTAKYSKELSGSSPTTTTTTTASTTLPVADEEEIVKSAKELAADASSADFGKEVKFSSDLKALLPTQKMRFMKLDKFGRRIQRMEDDGTVNMKKEPTKQRSEQQQETHVNVETTPATPADASAVDNNNNNPVIVNRSPSLAKLLGKRDRGSDPAIVDEAGHSGDLKGLLPKQNMRFMKLDKFGRRVQRMEDDGTVNMMKEPAASSPTGYDAEEKAVVDLDDSSSDTATNQNNYGSLKDLLSTKRATWTKLDVKGASVVDDRRTQQNKPDGNGSGGNDVGSSLVGNSSSSGNLKDLLPQKAIWTKLDFHGVSVVDERRTKQKKPDGNIVGGGTDVSNVVSNASSSSSSGGLKELLPQKAIWTKLDFHGASVVDERRTKQKPSSSSTGFNEEGQYSNLKDLLPARTITWKKNQVLSSGSSAPTTMISGNNAQDDMREKRQQAMREEVVASSANNDEIATSNKDEDDGDYDADATSASGEEKAYSNLKDLLPKKKFTFR